MFKHTVTYLDFNNKPHTEDIYFHMMVPEMVDLEYNPMFEGSLSDFIREGMSSGDGRKVWAIFKLLVLNSYGRRTEDGSQFRKKGEWAEEFLDSPAWEQFFLWLTDPEAKGKNGEAFWHGIYPEALKDKTEALEAAANKKPITEMSREELVELMEKTVAHKKAANEINS